MSGIDERALKESAVWNHLTNTVAHIAKARPENVVDSLENHSNLMLSGKMIPGAVTTVYMDNRPKAKQVIPANAEQDTEWAKKLANQVVPPKPAKKGDEEEEEPAAEEDKGELPDTVSEQEVFRTFGEGLSEIESYRINVAMKRLLDVEPLAKVRFWGKILGTKRDYYICEAKIDESRVPEKEEDAVEETEQVGKPPETIFQGLNTYRAREPVRVAAEEAKGVNEFKFYVATSDDLTDWTALPDVLPAHVGAARLINKLFTGHLDAAVQCHPPFPGCERHYLRAQICRISHATTVCPKDIYGTDAVEEDVEEEEEDGPKKPKRFDVPAYEEVPALNPTEAPDASDAEAVAPVKMWFFGYKDDELLEPKNWVHLAPQLLEEGRVTKFKPEDDAPPEDEPEDEPPAAPIEYVNPFLADLAHDRALTFSTHSRPNVIPWSVRKAYANESDTTRRYLMRSLLWPGALCYAEAETDKPGAQFQNCYVGRGVKHQSGQVYVPPLPPLPSVEFPQAHVRLQKDGTHDDELEFEPAPPPPKELADEENNDEEEDA